MTRDGRARFDALLSTTDVEDLICSSPLRFPGFRLVKAGEQLRASEYTSEVRWRPAPFTGVPDVERILREFENGATIVVQGLHLWWRPLAVLCRQLEGELGHGVQANAYYTPRSAQGLAVHHDTHDVLVLQVSGEKRWLVYEPAWELPLKNQLYSADGAVGAPVLDVTLRPGDTLYLPRGWLHEAVTSATDSLHLTVGITVYTWLDALRAAVEESGDDLAFRRAVAEDGNNAAELVNRLAERLTPQRVRARKREYLEARRRPFLDRQLTQLRAAAELSLETSVVRRPTVVAELLGGDGTLTLAFEGKRVTFPDRVARELRYVLEAPGSFAPAHMPGNLDAAGRLVLVRRLIREGVLMVTSADAEPSQRNGAGAAA